MKENTWDHRENSRTVLVNPVFAFLFMNMHYHIEHHMYPLMPFHALPRLHRRITDQMPAPYKGLGSVYREMIPALFRQKQDTEYFIKRPVPDGNTNTASVADAGESAETRDIDTGEWIYVCGVPDIDVSDALSFVHNGDTYAVFNLGERGFFATEGLCTHEQAPLAEGCVEDGCRIACPKHNARFDILSGKALTRPAQKDLKTFPVKVEEGIIYLKIK